MDKLSTVRACFRDFDKGNKGFLNKHDLKFAMAALFGIRPTKFEVEQILSIAKDYVIRLEQDRQKNSETVHDNSGLEDTEIEGARIYEPIFAQIMMSKLELVDEDDILRQVFCAFDVGCRGFLTFEDALRAFQVYQQMYSIIFFRPEDRNVVLIIRMHGHVSVSN
uniref:EF-hand domain-containing protein n=1 Tax=Aplanochytrium stocchinoi TaxID=215587 RepID=A0A7S3V2M3_9STRA